MSTINHEIQENETENTSQKNKQEPPPQTNKYKNHS